MDDDSSTLLPADVVDVGAAVVDEGEPSQTLAPMQEAQQGHCYQQMTRRMRFGQAH
jgi:hypothetical protein